MNTNSLRIRYEELKGQIHFHNHRYHVMDSPVISDAEYDKLLNELKRIEAEHLQQGGVGDEDTSVRSGAVDAKRRLLEERGGLVRQALVLPQHALRVGDGRGTHARACRSRLAAAMAPALVTASMRRTPAAAEASETMRKAPTSEVRSRCVPPQSS